MLLLRDPPAGWEALSQAGYLRCGRQVGRLAGQLNGSEHGGSMWKIGQSEVDSSQIDPSDLPDFCRKPIVVLGVGKTLFGDDGFGCAVEIGRASRRERE